MQVLRVRSCLAGSNARSVLKDGDILLTVAGRAVSHFQAVEAAVAGFRVDTAAPKPAAGSTVLGVASSSDIGDAASEVSSSRAHSGPALGLWLFNKVRQGCWWPAMLCKTDRHIPNLRREDPSICCRL